MFRAFYPGEYENSAYGLPYEKYFECGIRGIIFDIDNTLAGHGASADERAIRLFEYLREKGFSTCLLSNNKEARVASFAESVGSVYVSKAGKPGRAGYRKAMEKMGTSEKDTLFVGDQLFTDVYGANRCGIRSVLVRPLYPREEIQIVLKRRLEWIVLWFYSREQKKNIRKD